MTGLVTLSSKNQFTLPVGIVRELGLKKGSRLWTKVDGDTITIKKAGDTWDSLQGSLKDTSLTKGKSVLEIIELAGKIESKRLAKKYGV
ncbi:MAG: hypothetical protein UX91_C0007G0054 [Candidatus Amesbacteria bacterium GW2011_GWB1_47_19]|nr:MAG: hypothetical protein UW51_C0006G0125 [Candidatus Amesbacteria bacterium GW2011_GWA1_44_24]KKU31838.1 MAG: hypothetical protein UX46_C0002G0054 [Candidatus Amesbacteria bacterium GW2011_GWC1_46_24]KKU66774.1 MAG: hypothetical protein UX91_C0007G0054 [Candidatus Amesbacteria bacterium GW2011_GWB1_47_19]OGD05926.1 MAG: hypothetical protein A2379_00110 [Candidatus Amesbacteria bacterium RIFOXYB1_FULL_47_13]HBC73139.1 hypothetical protein [Candidatus Amesbacteria bacterium]